MHRLTAMVGWASTTDFTEKWVFDQTCDKYALVCRHSLCRIYVYNLCSILRVTYTVYKLMYVTYCYMI